MGDLMPVPRRCAFASELTSKHQFAFSSFASLKKFITVRDFEELAACEYNILWMRVSGAHIDDDQCIFLPENIVEAIPLTPEDIIIENVFIEDL